MLEQNRALWDQIQIRRGMQALERARQLGGADGSYTLQAAIIACHSEAESAADTDWSRIAGLYAQLVVVVPTCCRAFEVTYSTGSGVTKKPVPHSNRPRLWPATSANLAC